MPTVMLPEGGTRRLYRLLDTSNECEPQVQYWSKIDLASNQLCNVSILTMWLAIEGNFSTRVRYDFPQKIMCSCCLTTASIFLFWSAYDF